MESPQLIYSEVQSKLLASDSKAKGDIGSRSAVKSSSRKRMGRPPWGGTIKQAPQGPKSGLFDVSRNNEPGRGMKQSDHDSTRRHWKHFDREQRIKLETLCRTLCPDKIEINFADLALPRAQDSLANYMTDIA